MSTATLSTKTSDEPVLLAVSYLRVSTREQAERGGTEEGFSIPAQREANARKAAELGARIVREFIDAGASARSAERDGLQDMLALRHEAGVRVAGVAVGGGGRGLPRWEFLHSSNGKTSTCLTLFLGALRARLLAPCSRSTGSM